MDHIEEKQYYRISDVADFLGIPASTLRFWEKEFPELSPARTVTGLRSYSPEDIEMLRLIDYLVHIRGMRIEVAREHLASNRKNISRRLRIIDHLTDVRDELQVMLGALKKRRDLGSR